MLEIDWKLERSSTIPFHIPIYQYMRKKITLGEWPVGTKLPPQRKLAQMVHVNCSTVVTALDELKASGLIETKVGSGTVVANNTWNVLVSNHPPDWLRYVKSGIHQPNKLIIQEINKAEADERFIRLGTGELSPALLPNQQMWDLLKSPSGLPLHLNYMQLKGCSMLRKTVSGYLKQKGIEASPESILIFNRFRRAASFAIDGGRSVKKRVIHPP